VNRARYAFLVLRALFEMARYDVIVSSLSIGRILRQLRRQHVPVTPCSKDLQKAICDAVLLASCFYWKPVLCLQRSVCTTLLLRKYGIGARVAIGYRPAPFFSHAWVEVNGQVAYGSAAYRERLQNLATA
jgi:transglutaminase superfamily protein